MLQDVRPPFGKTACSGASLHLPVHSTGYSIRNVTIGHLHSAIARRPSVDVVTPSMRQETSPSVNDPTQHDRPLVPLSAPSLLHGLQNVFAETVTSDVVCQVVSVFLSSATSSSLSVHPVDHPDALLSNHGLAYAFAEPVISALANGEEEITFAFEYTPPTAPSRQASGCDTNKEEVASSTLPHMSAVTIACKYGPTDVKIVSAFCWDALLPLPSTDPSGLQCSSSQQASSCCFPGDVLVGYARGLFTTANTLLQTRAKPSWASSLHIELPSSVQMKQGRDEMTNLATLVLDCGTGENSSNSIWDNANCLCSLVEIAIHVCGMSTFNGTQYPGGGGFLTNNSTSHIVALELSLLATSLMSPIVLFGCRDLTPAPVTGVPSLWIPHISVQNVRFDPGGPLHGRSMVNMVAPSIPCSIMFDPSSSYCWWASGNVFCCMMLVVPALYHRCCLEEGVTHDHCCSALEVMMSMAPTQWSHIMPDGSHLIQSAGIVNGIVETWNDVHGYSIVGMCDASTYPNTLHLVAVPVHANCAFVAAMLLVAKAYSDQCVHFDPDGVSGSSLEMCMQPDISGIGILCLGRVYVPVLLLSLCLVPHSCRPCLRRVCILLGCV